MAEMAKKDKWGYFLYSAYAFFSIVFIFFVALANAWGAMRYMLAAQLILSSTLLVFRVRRNVILFFIAIIILFANWSACAANVDPSINSYGTSYASSPLSAEAIGVTALFMSTLLLLLPNAVRSNSLCVFERLKGFRYAVPFTVALVVLLLLIFITSSGGFVESGERAQGNSLYEYSYILYSLGFVIAGGNKGCRRALTAVALLYIVQAFSSQNRVNALLIVCLLFIVYLSDKVTWASITPLLLIGITLMLSIGYFRVESDYSLFMALFRFGDALSELAKDSFVWDTAMMAFRQCIGFLDVGQNISSGTHSYLIGQWIKSWFLGAAAVPDGALTPYVQARVGGLGGGFLPLYGYFYFGPVGVVVFAAVVAFWFRRIIKLDSRASIFEMVVCLNIASTFCRWYLYSPSPFTSGLFFSFAISLFISLFVPGFWKRAPSDSHICKSQTKIASEPISENESDNLPENEEEMAYVKI